MTARQHIYNILRGLKGRGARKRDLKNAKAFIEMCLGETGTTICAYCEKVVDGTNFSLDHRIPVSRGGPHTMINLAICCKRCNMAKGALSSSEFVGLLEDLADRNITKYVIPRLIAAGGAFRWRRR